MSDDEGKFEERLRREAAHYNMPPAQIARQAMWAAIAAARSRDDEGRPVLGGRGVPVPNVGPRSLWRRAAWIGMAATLLIGVAVGRYMTTPASPVRAVADGPAAAEAPEGEGYRMARAQHLARAEALLTAYSALPADSPTDVQLTRWAQDVLANTRLLLDSPAGRDAQARRLMEDLELVLVQLVQRPVGARAIEERSLIDRSLERTQVLPRLRLSQAPAPNSGT